MNTKLKIIHDTDYEKQIKTGKILLIVGAAWCIDTMHLVNKVLPKFLAKISHTKVLYVDVEDENGTVINEVIKRKLEIKAYPTIFAIVDGVLFSKKETEEQENQEKDLKDMLAALEDAQF